MRRVLAHRLSSILAVTVFFLLLCKYFWSFVRFPGVPFGYDAGIYRYLFQMRTGLQWIEPESLPNWAQSHAPGLFFFTAPLVQIGVPVDWLIGWVWNLIPIIVACVLAAVIRRRSGNLVAFFTLLAALLSVVQYEGFLMMYWKVMVAFLWCTLAFDARERGSSWWIPFGVLTITTHQQIGLLFVAAVVSGFLMRVCTARDTASWKDAGLILLTFVLSATAYLPTYRRSLGDILPLLFESTTLFAVGLALTAVAAFIVLLRTMAAAHKHLLWLGAAFFLVIIFAILPTVADTPEFVTRFFTQKSDAIPGAFLTITDYLRLSFPLFLLGVAGLVISTEKERGTPWQWAALWCAVAAFGMFFFYRRFLLPMDFFFLPFVALALASLWKAGRTGRVIAAAAVLVQGFLLVQHLLVIDPHIEREWLEEFATLETVVTPGEQVVSLDTMAPWILGYLPQNSVSGPGIFDSYPLADWETFLLGEEADRRKFFERYPQGTYFYASPLFFAYYPPEILSVLEHPCLTTASRTGLYASVCGHP